MLILFIIVNNLERVTDYYTFLLNLTLYLFGRTTVYVHVHFFNVVWNTKRKNLHSVGIFCNFFPKNNISSIVLNVFIVNYNQISCSLHNEWIMDIITEYLNFFYIATNKSYERMKQIILVRGSRYRFGWIKKQFFNVLSQERKDVNPTALFALNSNMLLGFTISNFFR